MCPQNTNNEDRIGRTRLLIDRMKAGMSFEEILQDVQPTESLSSMLLKFTGRVGMSTERMAEFAGLSRAAGYKIMNGKMRPEADSLIRLAFVLELTVDETQALLKAGHRATLSGSNVRDAAILYGLMNKISLGEMDELLEENGLAVLVPMGKI